MAKFNVQFCRNKWKNTLNTDDVIALTVCEHSFDKARNKARKMANEMGYSGKDGWKWCGTKLMEEV